VSAEQRIFLPLRWSILKPIGAARPDRRSFQQPRRSIKEVYNNACIFIAKPFTQYTEADYAAILGVNVTGFFHITQLAVAEMEKQGSGHVVQTTTSLSATRSPAYRRCSRR
jgi:NADP-dependent 3-hydroxy acid dehydrogenase YdfG